MYLEQMQVAVEKGAIMLDEKRPGWYQKVDLERLDLRFCARCVLGQISGNKRSMNPYDIECHALGLSPADAVAYGFNQDAAPEFASIRQSQSWADLTRLWREQITRRREEDEQCGMS